MTQPKIFQIGPENLKFMDQTFPMIEKYDQLIAEHNSAVAKISSDLVAAIEKARGEAVTKYINLCNATVAALKGDQK
jgi:hypothetical protein